MLTSRHMTAHLSPMCLMGLRLIFAIALVLAGWLSRGHRLCV